MNLQEIFSYLQDPLQSIETVLKFAQDCDFHPGVACAIIGRSDCTMTIACELIDRSAFNFSVVAAVINSPIFKSLPSNTKVIKNEGEEELGKMYKLIDASEYLSAA